MCPDAVLLERGTARALAPIAPYVAGKTGTTEDYNDAWFVAFTNEITVAVWVGYDNSGDTRRTLGDGATGAAVAAPIVQSIIEGAWSQGMSKTALAPPSVEAMSRLSCKSRDFETSPGERSTTECLRLDPEFALAYLNRASVRSKIGRFEDAVATLSVVPQTARHEQERAARIAINMRGHIR